MLTRRNLLKGAVLGGAMMHASGRAAAQELPEEFIPPPSPSVSPFTRRLPIPRIHLPLNRPGATSLERARAQAIYQQAQAEGRFQHPAVSPDDACDYYEVTVKPGMCDIIPGMMA